MARGTRPLLQTQGTAEVATAVSSLVLSLSWRWRPSVTSWPLQARPSSLFFPVLAPELTAGAVESDNRLLLIFQAHRFPVLITFLICTFGGTPGVGAPVGFLMPFLSTQWVSSSIC